MRVEITRHRQQSALSKARVAELEEWIAGASAREIGLREQIAAIAARAAELDAWIAEAVKREGEQADALQKSGLVELELRRQLDISADRIQDLIENGDREATLRRDHARHAASLQAIRSDLHATVDQLGAERDEAVRRWNLVAEELLRVRASRAHRLAFRAQGVLTRLRRLPGMP